MFDHLFSASHQGRDASILSSISGAITGERGPWRSEDRNPEREDELFRLRSENAELRAENERLSRLPESVREIFASRPYPVTDEDEVVEFEPIAEAVEIGRKVRSAKSFRKERATIEVRAFERRRRNAFLELRTRFGSEEAIGLSTLRKVGGLNVTDRPSATIIVFPVGRTRVGQASVEEPSSETNTGSTTVDPASLASLDDGASASSGAGPVEQDVASAESILEDLISAVDAAQPSLGEEELVALIAEDVALVEDEGAGAAPNGSEVYDPVATISDDEQPTVEAPEVKRGRKDWTRSQRRHFSAWASVGQSATAIARKMEHACGMGVSVGTVWLALAERAEKLSRVERRENALSRKSRPM